MNKIRNTKKSVYILTEGETEEAYFSRIAEIVGSDTEWIYSVTVEVREIIRGSKTDPVHMVNEAKRKKKEYDEVWVVFDKDRERDNENKRALDNASKSKVNVAFSSISFEHWLILYFERKDFAFFRSDCESRGEVCNCNGLICASTYLKTAALYPTFKKGYSLIYDDIQAKNAIAIENAAWLRMQRRPYSEKHILNPYTDVDKLLCELLNLNRVEYASINEIFRYEKIDLNLTNFERDGNNISIMLTLTNHGDIAFPINNNLPFKLVDIHGNSYAFDAIQATILAPNEFQNMKLDFTINSLLYSVRFTALTVGKTFLVDLPI
jgi:hypothetical protein